MLAVPNVENSFRQSYWCFNVIIYDEVRQKPFAYFWSESIATNGSQEVGSCLLRHIQENVPSDTERIFLYCEGNKNLTRNLQMSIFLKKLLDKWPHDELQSIEQRFFAKGHVYNSCSRCFNQIESAAKSRNIYVPEQWAETIENAKKGQPKITLVKMTRENFFTCEVLEEMLDPTNSGLNFEWDRVRSITHTRNQPYNFQIKKFGELVQTYILETPVPAYTFCNTDLNSIDYPRAISKSKYDDLQAILATSIPKKHHVFYKDLLHLNDSEPDLSLTVYQQNDDEDGEA